MIVWTYKNGWLFFLVRVFIRCFALTSEQLSTGPPQMQNDDIQGMDDSDNPRVPGNIHHIQNLNYEVVYINSFNTHKFKMQDSNNHNSCWSLSSCCSSIVSDEARSFIRSSLTVATSGTTSWPTSLAKFYSHPGPIAPLVLHRAIFIDHGFLLFNRLRHSFAYYWALGEAYRL